MSISLATVARLLAIPSISPTGCNPQVRELSNLLLFGCTLPLTLLGKNFIPSVSRSRSSFYCVTAEAAPPSVVEVHIVVGIDVV